MYIRGYFCVHAMIVCDNSHALHFALPVPAYIRYDVWRGRCETWYSLYPIHMYSSFRSTHRNISFLKIHVSTA